MIYKYYLACKEAGLSDEKIREIDQVFDRDKKKVAYDKAVREEEGIVFNSLSSFLDKDGEEIEFPACEEDVAEKVLRQIEIDLMTECLHELPKEDMEFLYRLFSGDRGIETQMRNELGMTRSEFRWKKKTLLKSIKEKILKKVGGDHDPKV